MTLEQEILKVVETKMADGSFAKIIEEEFEKGVRKAASNLFSSYGDVNKAIESQIKSVMVPFIEGYDYKKYIVKMDSVLQDVLKSSALENKKLLENFKNLMLPGGEENIKITDLFKEYQKYVGENVETDDLEICYDDGEPTYEYVDVSFTVEEAENPSWSNMKSAIIYFTCEQDEKMNIAIPIHTWKDWDKDKWCLDYKTSSDIKSIRRLNEFEIGIMKLTQCASRILLDKDYGSDEIEPDNKPEVSFR